MKRNILLASGLAILSLFQAHGQSGSTSGSFYRFQAKLLDGQEVSMKNYEGKVVLIVNTASKCGFTPQYEGLEALYKKYADQGFVILGFPCNQFANQEPGNAQEIASFCHTTYGVTFPMFEKIDVNGVNATPLYKWLKQVLPGTMGNAIKWNFTKFLLDRHGNPVKRYAPQVKPESIEKDIEALLSSH
ncbi:MAG: glutathione peroxidase [Microbacter sp.]